MTPSERQSRLVAELTSSGALSSAWRATFSALPRCHFVPDEIWIEAADGMRPLRRTEKPEHWFDLVYADEPITIQVDDGRPAEGIGRNATSSASQPSVVAEMLEALNISERMSVLEIGTGTGYNAALLAHRLGVGKVTSIEIDPEVAAHARKKLAMAGADVRLVLGDGADGWPEGAPYDRVIATAGVHQVPYAWIDQTRPGGIVLTPWVTDYHNGALLRLVVAADGTASGSFIGNAAFMRLRAQRIPPVVLGDRADGDVTVTGTHPYEVVGTFDASFAIGLRVPSCQTGVTWTDTDSDTYTVWFADPASGSQARLHHEPGLDAFEVTQSGPRRLWDEIAAAYQFWVALGRPSFDQYGIVVGPDGQTILDPEDRCSR